MDNSFQEIEKIMSDLAEDETSITNTLITQLEDTAKQIRNLSKVEQKRLTRHTPFLFASMRALNDLRKVINHSKMI